MRDKLKRPLLAAIAGVTMACAFPPLQWPLVLPLGFAFLIAAIDGEVTVRVAAYLGLVTGLVFYGITLPWLFNLFGAAAVSLLFIVSAFMMLFAGVYVYLRKRFPAVPVWLLAAVLWSGIEYYRSELFWLNFGWMGLGYAPIGMGLFAGAASVAGSYGISFLVVSVGAALAVPPVTGPAQTLYRAALTVLWIMLFLIPGHQPQPNNPISVRLVQNRAGEEQDSIRLSNPKEAGPVDVILWPEYSLLEDPTRNPRLWSALQDVARKQNAYFIFGGKEQLDPQDDRKYHNTAFVLDPAGNLAGKHYKNHPVHFILDGVRGTEAKPINTGLGKLGVGICFDMDYPDVARRLVQQGAEVLLVPNMDPQEWGDLQRAQHRLMFQMRAAECGRWLARADVAGGTSVAAPDGREVERIRTADPSSMDVIVGREQGKTLYVMGGWLFGPACLAAGAGLWALGLRRRRIAVEPKP